MTAFDSLRGPVECEVVWRGGELLPDQPWRSALCDVIERVAPATWPTPPRQKRRRPPLRDVLRARLSAHLIAHPPADGRCACGCGSRIVFTNGRRRFLPGHRRVMDTASLRARCAACGLPAGLRDSVLA